ncbi:hypothetical protein GCM10011273_01980 [Asticcacaulis endophyticus]|uniref:Uncharacterized protein n=1 Tax=Asticcacaulis endophyticus TaxID=1395890 RepID=A0A918ULS1_9CAUL|nr:hypothetical protein GCM10011273_01980 [Asticcacaulis endophyticus]
MIDEADLGKALADVQHDANRVFLPDVSQPVASYRFPLPSFVSPFCDGLSGSDYSITAKGAINAACL